MAAKLAIIQASISATPRGPISSPRHSLLHTPPPNPLTLCVGPRVNQTPFRQNHSFFVSVTCTTLSSLLVGGIMPSPRASLFARSMSSMRSGPCSKWVCLPTVHLGYFRFPKALTEKVWEDAMQEQDNEALISRRNTTNLKRIKRQIASVFAS